MKKLSIPLALMAFCGLHAQVGINNSDPKSTMDIVKNAKISSNGLLIPRLTSGEIVAMTAGADQTSMMVYLLDAVPAASRTGAYVNMDSAAHYYFDGTVWLKYIDTNTRPSGLERKPSPSATANFGWRYIGADPAQYGTVGQFASDLSWNPTDMNLTFPLVGNYTTALGLTGLAIADMGALAQGSFVNGALNSAKGPFSSLLGAANSSSASANFSFAAGALNKIQNNFAGAIGYSNISSGSNSFTAGSSNQSSGDLAIALGNTNIASGNSSVALGNSNTASGAGSFAVGQTNKATVTNALAMGNSNTASGNNAIAMGILSIASAENAFALGQQATASAQAAVAIGPHSQAKAKNSYAMGPDTVASGEYSFSLGNGTLASGLSSFALGQSTEASGDNSFTLGNGNLASGKSSFALGQGTIASSMSSFSIGQFNTTDATPEETGYENMKKRLFTIGNGTSSAERSDAFMVLRDGRVGINFNNFETTTNNANLQVNGSTQTQGFGANFKFGNTISDSDYTVVLDGNATLPTSTENNKGKIYIICSDGNLRTLSGTLQDSGGSVGFFVLGDSVGGRCVHVQSVGDGRWWIIGRN